MSPRDPGPDRQERRARGVTARLLQGKGRVGAPRFGQAFTIGTAPSCDVQVDAPGLPPVHAEVLPDGILWWIRDLSGGPGTFVNGARAQMVPLRDRAEVELGKGGPRLELVVQKAGRGEEDEEQEEDDDDEEAPQPAAPARPSPFDSASPAGSLRSGRTDRDPQPPAASQPGPKPPVATLITPVPQKGAPPPVKTELQPARPATGKGQPPPPRPDDDDDAPTVKRPPRKGAAEPGPSGKPATEKDLLRRFLRKDAPGAAVGHETMMFRKALATAKKRSLLPWQILASVALTAALLAAGVIYHQQRKLTELRASAEKLFYASRAMEVEVAQLEEIVLAHTDRKVLQELLDRKSRHAALEAEYDSFVRELGVYAKASRDEQVIMRVARAFGECGIGMPKDFVAQVRIYVDRWRTSNRLANALKRSAARGYGPAIQRVFVEAGLPQAVRLPAAAGERLRRPRGGPAHPLRPRQGHVAVHLRHRHALRPADRSALQSAGLRPARRPVRLAEGHHRGRALHQGAERRGGPGLRAPGPGLLQLGRDARPGDHREPPGQPAGAELLAAAP
ncbi:MAG: FHA domain-containing protein [Anaeromyxobacter sp.]